jgi:hypothetical protein
LRGAVSAGERVVAQDASDGADKDKLVVPSEELARAELAQSERDLGHERDRADAAALGRILAAFVGEAALYMEQRI